MTTILKTLSGKTGADNLRDDGGDHHPVDIKPVNSTGTISHSFYIPNTDNSVYYWGAGIEARSRDLVIRFATGAAREDSQIISASEAAAYKSLFSVLESFPALSEDDHLWIDEETYRSASSVLSLLSYRAVVPPKIFSHGGDAVVFAWSDEKGSTFITVSEGFATVSYRPIGGLASIIKSCDLSEGCAELLRYLKVRGGDSRTNSV